jgi:hypothetical protein
VNGRKADITRQLGGGVGGILTCIRCVEQEPRLTDVQNVRRVTSEIILCIIPKQKHFSNTEIDFKCVSDRDALHK